MSVATAEELFVDELKDIYSAEKQAVKAFPRLAKAVQSEELKQAMQDHLEQTKGQVERLDRDVAEHRVGGDRRRCFENAGDRHRIFRTE